jgi:site-specific DNA-cytosine methylase
MTAENRRPLRGIDLCCGGGGWAAAGRGLPIEWVCVADIAADCLETWRVNHAEAHPRCEIVECDLSESPGRDAVIAHVGDVAVDFVVGGIPCEQVSIARSRACPREELEAWHRLIDSILGLVDHLRPRWWALEDVIQVEKHLPGPLFHGREIPRTRIEAAEFGPQRRLRTYLGEFPAPLPVPGPRTVGECLRPGPHLIIPRAESYESAFALDGALDLNGDTIRILRPDWESPAILCNVGMRGGRNKRSFTIEDARGRRRQLSWQEAAAIQGFPDDYLFASSLTRAMQMIGRAIPICVGRAILTAMCDESGVRRAECGEPETAALPFNS